MLPDEHLNNFNSVIWVISNVALAYSGIALVIFIVAYYLVFDHTATTGGKILFQFMLSLVGVMFLAFVGVFINPSPDRSWIDFDPNTVDAWRPILRLIVYGFVAYAISALITLLALRKWYPHRIRKASDILSIKVRHTAEIPIINLDDRDSYK